MYIHIHYQSTYYTDDWRLVGGGGFPTLLTCHIHMQDVFRALTHTPQLEPTDILVATPQGVSHLIYDPIPSYIKQTRWPLGARERENWRQMR